MLASMLGKEEGMLAPQHSNMFAAGAIYGDPQGSLGVLWKFTCCSHCALARSKAGCTLIWERTCRAWSAATLVSKPPS